jgi:hypothetical protein
MNPYSPRLDSEYYLGLFPGFLHMLHEPEKHFPPHVKTVLMSQSDFQLPDPGPRDLPQIGSEREYKYDFTYAATWPLATESDTSGNCMGWSGYCKNWTFAKAALEVMCGEYGMTGVLVATQEEHAGPTRKHCNLPPSCEGKMIQTSFLNQHDYFNYLKYSRFAFIPQVHDASPRVSTQALIHDIPLLMNRHISGGWKYMNDQTGEFFTDMSDFRQSLEKIIKGTVLFSFLQSASANHTPCHPTMNYMAHCRGKHPQPLPAKEVGPRKLWEQKFW